MTSGAAAGGYAGDEYEEDFESYEDEQQGASPHTQQAAAEVQQRMRILRNVNSISR
jgi:hypothetical protein